MFKKILLCSVIAILGAIATITIQQPPAIAEGAPTIKRTPLQTFDVPGTNLETVIAMAEIVPNVLIGKRTHPGIEGAYLLAGELTLMIDGQPPLVLKAGQSYSVPLSAAHDAKSGPVGAKVLVTYVVEKGKPLASPVK
jgi:quercetin dioxygenase-like cupin family protein